MSRPRKPTATLELNGAFRKNPNRARPAEPQPIKPLGAPPKHLDAAVSDCWIELAEIIPVGVLGACSRWVVEVACRLMAKMRAGGISGPAGLSAAELSQLIQCLARMGMTPSDRSKVSVAKPEEKANRFTSLDEEPSARVPVN